MKFLVILLTIVFSMGVSYKSFGQSAAPNFSDAEVDSSCFSLEALKRLLACYTLQTKEACLRESKWTSDSGSGENAEVNFVVEISDAVEEAHSLLQKFGSCYESQGDAQHCPKNDPRGPLKILIEEKAFCFLNLECGNHETEVECQDRKNNELDCNVKAVAAAQERFCSDWIPADKLTGTPPKS